VVHLDEVTRSDFIGDISTLFDFLGTKQFKKSATQGDTGGSTATTNATPVKEDTAGSNQEDTAGSNQEDTAESSNIIKSTDSSTPIDDKGTSSDILFDLAKPSTTPITPVIQPVNPITTTTQPENHPDSSDSYSILDTQQPGTIQLPEFKIETTDGNKITELEYTSNLYIICTANNTISADNTYDTTPLNDQAFKDRFHEYLIYGVLESFTTPDKSQKDTNSTNETESTNPSTTTSDTIISTDFFNHVCPKDSNLTLVTLLETLYTISKDKQGICKDISTRQLIRVLRGEIEEFTVTTKFNDLSSEDQLKLCEKLNTSDDLIKALKDYQKDQQNQLN
jgi:hypothetical protein